MKKFFLTMAVFIAIATISFVFISKESGCSNTNAGNITSTNGIVHTDYMAGKVAYNDSSYVDSIYYPYTTSVFDASLITGQVDSLNATTYSGIIYRVMLVVPCPTGVTCTPTNDTVWAIICTKDEGGYRWLETDTITILGRAATAAPTDGSFNFRNWPRGLWKIRFEEKKTLQHVNFTNRKGDYVLLSITSKNMDMIPPKINPGNY